MPRSLFAGVSGLRNMQTQMDIIGNNISNVNTVGFKASRVNFQDVLSQTMQDASGSNGNTGGTNPVQVGLGMSIGSIDTLFTDGSFQPTGKQTDLSIQGQGFFILSTSNGQVYTRAGNFDFDNTGSYLVPGTGNKVMGWEADNAGNINTTGTMTPIQIPIGSSMAAKTSTQITFGNNLGADATTGTSTATTINVYDTLGSSHKVVQSFTKVGANTWLGGVSVPDATTGTLTGALSQITFNSNGTVQAINALSATPTTTLAVPTMQLDNVLGSVHTATYKVYDANNGVHTLQATYTNTASNAWTLDLADTGTTPPTAVVTGGAVSYAAGAYTLPSFTYGGNTINFALGTQSVPSASGSFTATGGGQVLNLSNNFQMDSTLGDVNSTNYTLFDDNNVPHVFQATFTTTSASSWSYKVVDLANPSGTPAANGTVNFSGTSTVTIPTLRMDSTANSTNTVPYTLYDSTGSPHTVNVTFTANSTGTAWTYGAVDASTGAVVVSPGAGPMAYVAGAYTNFGPITYNGITTTLSPTAQAAATATFAGASTATSVPTGSYSGFGPINFGTNTAYAEFGTTNLPQAGQTSFSAGAALPYTTGASSTLSFTPTGGATAMSVNLTMTGITQYGGASTVQALSQDGYASGTLSETSTDPTGVIVGKFTNGQSKDLAQVALATFNNAAGLTKVGDSMFAESNNSGVAQIGTSGTGGRGTLNPGTLEMSNVDLAQEFSNMIITERGFQANSKIITTTDEMLQTLSDLKR